MSGRQGTCYAIAKVNASLFSAAVFRTLLVGIIVSFCGLEPLCAGVALGDTIARCDSLLGPAVPVPDATYLVCAQTHGYVKDGLSILVGFTDKGIAEEFIYSKVAYEGKPADLTAAECKAILEEHRETSSWISGGTPPGGPIWRRSDEGAYASYVLKGSRLVILSNEGMAEHMKKFNVKSE